MLTEKKAVGTASSTRRFVSDEIEDRLPVLAIADAGTDDDLVAGGHARTVAVVDRGQNHLVAERPTTAFMRSQILRESARPPWNTE